MIQNQDFSSGQTTRFLAEDHSFIWISGAVTVAALAALRHALKRRISPGVPDPDQPPTRFTHENITARFIAAIPSITRELNLEVATATQTETFTQSSARAVFWGRIDLGTNVVQVRVPVTYRYHIRLADPWELNLQGNVVHVTAPLIHASLPPAIHTDQTERLTVRGWARSSPRKLLEQLEKEITPRLSEHAVAPEQLELVRQACRLSVAEFVRLWLEREGQWHQDGVNLIQVRFTDETALPENPTLKLLA